MLCSVCVDHCSMKNQLKRLTDSEGAQLVTSRIGDDTVKCPVVAADDNDR